MEVEKMKAIIEAILFSAGRVVKINELILVLEKNEEEIQNIIENRKGYLPYQIIYTNPMPGHPEFVE